MRGTLAVLVGALALAVAGCGEDESPAAPEEPAGMTAKVPTPNSQASESAAHEPSKDCPAFDIRTSEGGITAELPCGARVEPVGSFSDRFVKHDGQRCLELDYKLGEVEETRVFCPGDEDPEGRLIGLRDE